MREREREKHWPVVPPIYGFIGWFLYMPWPGIKPTALAYWDDALTSWATRAELCISIQFFLSVVYAYIRFLKRIYSKYITESSQGCWKRPVLFSDPSVDEKTETSKRQNNLVSALCLVLSVPGLCLVSWHQAHVPSQQCASFPAPPPPVCKQWPQSPAQDKGKGRRQWKCWEPPHQLDSVWKQKRSAHFLLWNNRHIAQPYSMDQASS